ncbi:MAG: hypothetical protein GEV11_17630 [Streptosporangiales bacterium]|nr:hypothetical protein [Streptosporangiales bacterium]
MSHLGERLSALVDGELGHGDRERALRHLAVCEQCRFEAEMLRRLKRRLHGLGGPGPSGDLMVRLLSMSDPGEPLPPPMSPFPGTGSGSGEGPLSSGGFGRTSGFGGTATAVAVSAQTSRSRSGLRRRGGRYALAGASLMALAISTAFAVGGEPTDGTPSVTPSMDAFAVEHALTSGGVPPLGRHEAVNTVGSQPQRP